MPHSIAPPSLPFALGCRTLLESTWGVVLPRTVNMHGARCGRWTGRARRLGPRAVARRPAQQYPGVFPTVECLEQPQAPNARLHLLPFLAHTQAHNSIVSLTHTQPLQAQVTKPHTVYTTHPHPPLVLVGAVHTWYMQRARPPVALHRGCAGLAGTHRRAACSGMLV